MGTSVGMAGGSLADDGWSQEQAALVEHGLLDDLVRPQEQRPRDRQANGFRRLHIDDQLEFTNAANSSERRSASPDARA